MPRVSFRYLPDGRLENKLVRELPPPTRVPGPGITDVERRRRHERELQEAYFNAPRRWRGAGPLQREAFVWPKPTRKPWSPDTTALVIGLGLPAAFLAAGLVHLLLVALKVLP